MVAHRWLFLGLAVVGSTLTATAVSWWAPEATTVLADRAMVARQAVADAESLGFRVTAPADPGLTMGPRYYPAATDSRVLQERVPDRGQRRRLLTEAPPLPPELGFRIAGNGKCRASSSTARVLLNTIVAGAATPRRRKSRCWSILLVSYRNPSASFTRRRPWLAKTPSRDVAKGIAGPCPRI